MPRKKATDTEETKPVRKRTTTKQKATNPAQESPTPENVAVETQQTEMPLPAPVPQPQTSPVLISQLALAVAAPPNDAPHTSEQFDLNQVVATGTVRSVWGHSGDVYARFGISTRDLLVEEDDTFTVYATLRFADGMVGGAPVTLQPGDILTVHGYLVHRNYTESLRKFLEDADAINFLDSVAPADLPAWRTLALDRRNGIVNVLAMTFRRPDGEAITHLGKPLARSDLNRSSVEGIVSRVWEYRRAEGVDLFTRLAVYDPYTPIDKDGRPGNFGRPRRLAHYVNIRFPLGRTTSDAPVRITQKMRVRVVGQLRDKAQVVTLRDELLRTGSKSVVQMMQRVSDAERMSEIKNQQESLHIQADAVVVYSTGRRR
jgi:hypothetical protein